MTLSRPCALSGALVWASTALAVWAWFMLPEGAGAPVRLLSADGQVRTAVSREALWAIPILAPLVWTGLVFAPRFAGERVEEAAPELYHAILVAVAALLLAVEAALVAAAFDPAFDPVRPIALAAGALLIAVGNDLGKARRNRLVGLRLPWTLADARVWDKAHRFAGRGLLAGGVVLMALSLALDGPVALAGAIAGCVVLPVLAAAVWSWRLSRRLSRAPSRAPSRRA